MGFNFLLEIAGEFLSLLEKMKINRRGLFPFIKNNS